MLGKLFSYDMKALSRILFPVHCAALALGVVGMLVAFWWNAYADTHSMYLPLASSEGGWFAEPKLNPDYQLIQTVCNAVTVLCWIAILCTTIATFIVPIHRFYSNLLTDEGHLTLTLPVSASQIVTAKALAALLWIVIDVAVITACGILTLLGVAGLEEFEAVINVVGSVYGILGGAFETITDQGVFYLPYQLKGLLFILLGFWSSVMIAYLAFTLGGRAQRRKVLAGILWYLGISWGASLVSSVVSSFVGIALGQGSDTLFFVTMFRAALNASFVMAVVEIVAAFLLTRYMLARKVDAA